MRREAKAKVMVEWPDGSKDTWKTHRYGVLLRALACASGALPIRNQ